MFTADTTDTILDSPKSLSEEVNHLVNRNFSRINNHRNRMSNLETLLREWAAIEPERCKVIVSGIFDVLRGDHWFISRADQRYFDLELGAVQEAIEARGWTWIIESSTTAPRYGAALDEMGNASLEWKNADTPAEAILSAYLQAMKAQ